MKNGFLKVGIPVLCAVPVAAGFATMGYSAATALTGNFRVECDFCSFDSDDVRMSLEKGQTKSYPASFTFVHKYGL